MAFKAGNAGRAYFGALHLSGYVRDYNAAFSATAVDVTTLADTAKAFIIGQNESTSSLSMVFDVDAAANTQWSLLTAGKSSSSATPLTMLPLGAAAGDVAVMVGAWETSLTASAPLAGSVDIAMSLVTESDTDFGVVIDPATAVTADGNGTARDGGAATANGGVAHIHVTAFSGLTNDVVTIEHSVDGSTSWATLATFSTITGLTSERVVVAAGTTVRRYLRVVDNVTGTGSITRLVSFARR